MTYLVIGVRAGKVVHLPRDTVAEAFQSASKLRQLGYAVRVRRPGATTLEAAVVRAVTS